MKLEELTQTLDLLRAKGVRRAEFAAGEVTEVEFFGDASSPPDLEVSTGEKTEYERELDERTAGYEVALAQIGRRSFDGSES